MDHWGDLVYLYIPQNSNLKATHVVVRRNFFKRFRGKSATKSMLVGSWLGCIRIIGFSRWMCWGLRSLVLGRWAFWGLVGCIYCTWDSQHLPRYSTTKAPKRLNILRKRYLEAWLVKEAAIARPNARPRDSHSSKRPSQSSWLSRHTSGARVCSPESPLLKGYSEECGTKTTNIEHDFKKLSMASPLHRIN